MKNQILDEFVKAYGNEQASEKIRVFFAPGRVNLIGEHTDYNGGHVFPCALTIGTYGAVRLRNDNRLRFCSGNFEDLGVLESSLDKLEEGCSDWTRYVKAVIRAFGAHGYEVKQGFDFYCRGTIPNSSGLSSSASLELLVSKILIELFDFDVDMIKASLISQYAENRFVGVNCGIMDQFAIAMGKQDSAIFLDTATLNYEYVPVVLKDCKIVIGNTNKKRGLGDSKYNERRSECEHALELVKDAAGIKSLGELNEESFAAVAGLIDSEVVMRRARHAVLENLRTVKAVEALNAGDLAGFGKLMNESHISLRDDYEVTGKELDTLVEEAWKQEGVIGARMTGAGFGGCTVSIVKSESVDAFIKNVGSAYLEKIGYAADFYVVSIGSGPVEL